MTAEQEVLTLCRQHRGSWGMPCMRERSATQMADGAAGPCIVIDNARWDSPVLAAGATWDDVLAQLRARPAKAVSR